MCFAGTFRTLAESRIFVLCAADVTAGRKRRQACQHRRMPDVIFHITNPLAWQAAITRGEPFEAPSLETEGFIHCSTSDQVPWVANGRFRGLPEPLLLLRLDPGALTHELKWETSEPGMPPFPHVYGPIDLAAVVGTIVYAEEADGFPPLPMR